MSFFLMLERYYFGGMSRVLQGGAWLGVDSEGRTKLAHSGPFVPPIFSCSMGEWIVTESFRQAIIGCPLFAECSFEFRPVVKSLIVQHDWHLWDRSASAPQEWPPEDEEESYILTRPHSPELAEEIGDLWDWGISVGAEITSFGKTSQSMNGYVHVDPQTWSGAHLFRGIYKRTGSTLDVLVDEQGRAWLEEHAGDWLQFATCIEEPSSDKAI